MTNAVLDIQEVSRDDPFSDMDLGEVRDWLRITHTDEDADLRRYMVVAERQASIWCHASFAETTLKLTCHDFNTNAGAKGEYSKVALVRGPASSGTSMTDGTTTVSSGFSMDNRLPQRLNLPTDLQGNGEVDLVTQYVAGYASWTAMPAHVQHLLLMTMAHVYTQRQPVITGQTPTSVPWTLQACIAACQREAMP